VWFLATACGEFATVEGEAGQVNEGVGPPLCRGAPVVWFGWGSGGIESGLDVGEAFGVEPAVEAG
jgi:hypothetical protein